MLRRAAALACLFLALSGASCDGPPSTRRPDGTAPTLRLALITDLQGTLEPCGCTSRPLGGIDRMAARVAALRAEAVPVLVLAAGDLFYGEGSEAGAAAEQRQAVTASRVLGEIGVDAFAPGSLDLAPEVPAWQNGALGEAGLAAGVRFVPGDSADLLHDARVLTAGGVRIGVFGLTELAGARPFVGVEAEAAPALVDRARAQVAALHAQDVQLVVALLGASRRVGRRIAREVRGIDVLVQGGLNADTPVAPMTLRDTVVLNAGRRGQGLVVVDVLRRGEGSYVDASPWSVSASRERLSARIAELAARIEAWERDGAEAEDVAEQRARLAELRRQLEALAAPEPDGNAILARYEELDPDSPRAPAITALLAEHARGVNEHNRQAFAERRPEPAPPGQSHYVGSAACRGCHRRAFSWWRQHEHGRAYATLETRHKNFHLDCVACHVTGYGRPGGSTVTHLRDGALQDVGCESCHGAGSRHVADGEAPGLIARGAQSRVCLACHTPEHSDHFDYVSYRERLIVPGHGLPEAAGAQ